MHSVAVRFGKVEGRNIQILEEIEICNIKIGIVVTSSVLKDVV